MITEADVRVRVNVDMSLTEALELEHRLAGGARTASTEGLRRALAIQMVAAREAIDIPNSRSA